MNQQDKTALDHYLKKKITEILAVTNLMSSVDLDRHQNSFWNNEKLRKKIKILHCILYNYQCILSQNQKIPLKKHECISYI